MVEILLISHLSSFRSEPAVSVINTTGYYVSAINKSSATRGRNTRWSLFFGTAVVQRIKFSKIDFADSFLKFKTLHMAYLFIEFGCKFNHASLKKLKGRRYINKLISYLKNNKHIFYSRLPNFYVFIS